MIIKFSIWFKDLVWNEILLAANINAVPAFSIVIKQILWLNEVNQQIYHIQQKNNIFKTYLTSIETNP